MSSYICGSRVFFFICSVFFLSGCKALIVAPIDKKNSEAVVSSQPKKMKDADVLLTTGSPQKQVPSVGEKNEEQHDPATSPVHAVKTKTVYKSINVDGKQVVGALERIKFDSLGIELEARIDTGATTSSLNASDIQRFERDGKDWVSFVLANDEGKPVTVERQLARNVPIKRHGAKAIERPVIKLQITLGKVSMLAEFSLTDRSQFSYPVLVGRNILTDLMIVDVSHEHIASEKNGVLLRDK